MKCRLDRKEKKEYCKADFFYQIKLVNKTGLRLAKYGEKDASKETIKEINLMCHLKKFIKAFEVGGEIAGGEDRLNITAFMISSFQDIQNNSKLWEVHYKDEVYIIDNIVNVDFTNKYMFIDCYRTANPKF